MPCQFLWPELEKAFGSDVRRVPKHGSHDIDLAYPQWVATHTDIVTREDALPERNAIDGPITDMGKRPMASGHLGEWLASKVFGSERTPPNSR